MSVDHHPQVSVVLPTYNEADNIIPLMEQLAHHLKAWSFELIVVDDDSPDGTWRLVETHARQHASVRLIHRTDQSGLTSAINSGLQASRGEVVCWMDCDLSHPPELISQLVGQVMRDGGFDAALASRYVEGGSDGRSGPYRLQRLLSLTLSMLSRLLSGSPVRDITSGYIAIRRAFFEQHGWLRGDYGEYFIDLMIRLSREECAVVEIPYTFTNRQHGESKTGTNWRDYARRGVKYLRVLFTARWS